MQVLVFFLVLAVLVVGGMYLFSVARDRFQEDAAKLGEGFDDEDVLPGPEGSMSSMDPSFGQFVSVNLAMITGQFCVANWNNNFTELTVSVSKSDDETNKKVQSFLNRLEEENPVKINLNWH